MSQERVVVDSAGDATIQGQGQLNVSLGDRSHAVYYRDTRRPGGEIVSFEIPTWLSDFIKEEAIPQFRYGANPRNQRGMAPKIVDPSTPGYSVELPQPWVDWVREYAVPGSGRKTP